MTTALLLDVDVDDTLIDTGAAMVAAGTAAVAKLWPDACAAMHEEAGVTVEPSQTMYVGDHLKVDALAALDAGLYAVFLQRDPGDGNDAQLAQAHGIPVVSSLNEVATLLEGD